MAFLDFENQKVEILSHLFFLENVGSGNALLKSKSISAFRISVRFDRHGTHKTVKTDYFSDLVWVGALVAEGIQQIVQSLGHSPQVQGHLQ